MEIREYKETDREICSRILDGLKDWFAIDSANKGFISILGKIPSAVAVTKTGVSGFIAIEQHNPVSMEIHVLAVKKECHNSGIGSALLAWSESWCRKNGVNWLHVKTRGPSTPDPDYEKTRKFYESKGFDPLFETLKIWGPEDAALIMIKKL